MCDLTCNGRPVDMAHGLKIVAAINPYKKHSDKMIEKLEQAGLGFFLTADETREKFGLIPMRQLVYRVQPLPSSLLPIAWDFGQLERNVEYTYIEQMVARAVVDHRLPELASNEDQFIGKLIDESQNFMRLKNDECSFVSIRDVERVIKVTSWFFNKKELIFNRMNQKKLDGYSNDYQTQLSDIKRAFVLGKQILLSFENQFKISNNLCCY